MIDYFPSNEHIVDHFSVDSNTVHALVSILYLILSLCNYSLTVECHGFWTVDNNLFKLTSIYVWFDRSFYHGEQVTGILFAWMVPWSSMGWRRLFTVHTGVRLLQHKNESMKNCTWISILQLNSRNPNLLNKIKIIKLNALCWYWGWESRKLRCKTFKISKPAAAITDTQCHDQR